MKKKRHYFKLAVLLFIYLTPTFAGSQTKTDSIGQTLSHQLAECYSCPYYNDEDRSAGWWNTSLAFLMVAAGTTWLYTRYRKKYLIVIGSLVGLTVVGTYLHTKMHHETSFSSSGSNDTIQNAGDTTTTIDAVFAPTSDEFETKNAVFDTHSIDLKQIVEPVVIFLIIGLISLMIHYPWFRKTRGVFLLAGLVYLGFYQGACPCMISSFQNMVLLLAGTPVKPESLLWLLTLVLATYLFGKVWCGWLCPFGALQEFLYRSPKTAVLTTKKAQKILKTVQISVFIAWVLQLLMTKTNLYCRYDPFNVAFNPASSTIIGYFLLAVLLISSVLIYRPFCRTVCPVGLILGWTTHIPGSRKLVKDATCLNCENCSNVCKQCALTHENKVTTLREEDCIVCGECFSACSLKALNTKWKR